MECHESIGGDLALQPGVGGRSACFRLMLIAALCLFGGGCGLGEWARNGFKVGPNYKPPPAPIASHWIDYQPGEEQAPQQAGDLRQWWHVFNDPVLNSLVSDAYRQNLTLRAAGERIAESRAQRGIAVGNLFPQTQTLGGSYTANKASTTNANAFQQQWYQNAQVGFNMNWELDFWGRFRRSIEAADASLDASVADYDNLLVILLADVASNYIQYRTFQERLELAKVNVQIQEESYQLASDSFRLGRSTERDPQQARQILEQTRSAIPTLEAGLRQTNNALCVLLGVPPQELAQRLGESGAIPVGTPQLSSGIPADLLRRRPDVRRAERQAAAQSANIGVAKADLYPRFVLLGSIGLQAAQIGDMFHTPGSVAASGGPAFQWNILNYGRIENAVKVQEAAFRQFVYQYQDTVLRANEEAENAIIGYAKAQERAKYLGDSVTAAQRVVQITYDQYRQGAVDFTPVFIFEAALTSQQDSLAQAQGDTALNLVDLFRTLGGGWEAGEDPAEYEAPAVPAPTTQRASTRPTTMPTTRP
ncbi:MAG TPA: efflux transporter outer membrane subunit [Humisphaera sp.]|jgi:NodT family efflux transporter outer membrane factor (OMF) lipoprotein|nr:efflux transporter outer membrane subunit [Humisphaera sp.]